LAVEIYCAECVRKLKIRDEAVGKKVRCPACKAVFVAESIPVLEEVEPPPATAGSADRPRRAAAPRTDEPAEPRRSDPDAITDRPQPAADPLPELLPDEPDPDFVSFAFKAVVKDDPREALKGTLQATVTREGVRLHQGRKVDLLLPPGTRAKYLQGNQLRAEVDGRPVTLAVNRFGSYQARMARDVSEFLAGRRRSLDPKDYRLEWYLYLPAVLPMGIPILTVGGAIWGALGFGVAAGCFTIAQMEQLPKAVRLGLALALNVVAYALVGLLWMMQLTHGGPGRNPFATPAPFGQTVPTKQVMEFKEEAKRAEPFAQQPAAPAPAPVDPVEALKAGGLAFTGGKPLGAVFFPGHPVLLIVDKEKGVSLRGLPEGKDLPNYPPDGRNLSDVVQGYRFISGGDVCRLFRLQDGRIAGPNAADELKRDMGAATPNGNRVVTYSPTSDKVHAYNRSGPYTGMDLVRHWDVGRGNRVVTGIDVDPEGRTVAFAFADGQVEFRDIGSGAVRIRGDVPGVSGFFRPVFSPSGKVLAAPSYSSSQVALLDPNSGSVKGVLSGDSDRPAWTVAFSPDSQKLAAGSLDGEIRLYDIGSGQSLAQYRVDPTPAGGKPAQEQMITSLSFSSDGRYLAATDANATRVWDVGGHLGAPLPPAPLPRAAPLHYQLISPPNRGKPEGTGQSDTEITTRMPQDRVSRILCLAPDSKSFAIGTRDCISLWDLEGPTERAVIPVQDGDPDEGSWIRFSGGAHGARVMSFSADGKSLISAAYVGTVRVWDVASGRLRQSFKIPEPRATCAGLSPDGRTAAAGVANGIRVWDVETGRSKDLAAVDGSLGFAGIAFAPDGKTLAAYRGVTIVVLDVASGQTTATLTPQDFVTAVAFAPDGKTLASAGTDGKVRLWDVATGTARELEAIRGETRALSFSPDGKRLLAIARYGGLRAWDVATRTVLVRREVRYGDTAGVTPDHRCVVAGESALHVWYLPQPPFGGSAP
jgi:WD40 repeat protein